MILCNRKITGSRRGTILAQVNLLSLLLLFSLCAYGVPISLETEAGRARAVGLFEQRDQARQMNAVAVAKSLGWETRGITRDAVVYELMKLLDGRPYYHITLNLNAAISTAADRVRNTAPYNLNGYGIIAGVWDGGSVLQTHQEFNGRVIVQDGSAAINHTTHVGGTIGAGGVETAAMGMAPSVTIYSYDWNNDLSEMTSRAATMPGQEDNIYISNHSYEFATGWIYGSFSGNPGRHWFGVWNEREDRGFGLYSQSVRDWDSLCYNAPYFLPFKAAGNDRNDSAPASGTTFYYSDNRTWQSKQYDPATDPYDDYFKGGYNTIAYRGVAKNLMTVGAVSDAVGNGQRDPESATMAVFSSWGPADDGRIKPDIVANGVTLYSSRAGSSTAYGISSGTSMSSPNAAGSALLLVQLYRSLFPGQDMRSSMLKGLIIHTADDMGNPGPDYRFGWGLMNTEAAANHIQAHYDNQAALFMVEDRVTSTQPSRTYPFFWNAGYPIKATLSWTDPPGTAQDGLNITTPVLVNDLDLRIIGPEGGAVYMPYVLDPLNPANNAGTGDNTVDNVEQVYIPNPPESGQYEIQITHKGAIANSGQYFSLLVGSQDGPNPSANSASATYTVAHISTDAIFQEPGDSSGCPGFLEVTIPNNAVITSVDVSYTMTAALTGQTGDQRSQLRCVSPGGVSESTVYAGTGDTSGSLTYTREGLDIANGVTGGGVIAFELHAGRTGNGSNCSTNFNRVDTNTWTVTVHYDQPDTLCLALNNCDLLWTTSGYYPWEAQTAVSNDGEAAAQSGDISKGQNSWLETAVERSGSLSFWWKVSSAEDQDYLSFYINDTLQERISGDVDWQQRVYTIYDLSVLRWVYTKEADSSAGMDAGWLDMVDFTPGEPAEGEPVEGEDEIKLEVSAVGDTQYTKQIGDDVTFAVEVTGEIGALAYQWHRITPDETADPIAGAFEPTYTIYDIEKADWGNYQCQVYDFDTDEEAWSPVFTLILGEFIPAFSAFGLIAASVMLAVAGAVTMKKRND